MKRIAVCASLLLLASAYAEVTRVEVLSSQPFGSFQRGPFLLQELRVTGELDPAAEALSDMKQAQTNARGRVEYETHVTLISPAAGPGNGTLLVDIPNRSRATTQALLNSPRNTVLPLGEPEPGNGFLQEQGFSTAAIYWELGAKDVKLPTTSAANGKPMSIEAAAFPMFRDVAYFLTHAVADASGTPNPLAGRVQHTLVLGYSQSGRFAKTLLSTGHNRVSGRPVFEGMLIFGAAAGQITLTTHEGTASAAGTIPTFDNPQFRGVHEEKPWLSVAQLTSMVAGRGEPLPKMLFVNTTTDYWSLRASLGRTGLGSTDAPLPDSVRMYDIAGGSHALVSAKSTCSMPYARLDWHPVLRSTLLVLDRWVKDGTPPPPNELMPLVAASSDDVLRAPSHLKEAVVRVPARDPDGNAVGGIRLPDVEVPLGTNAVQNPPLNFLCSLAAGFSEFKRTPQEREAASDSRPSLAERYKTVMTMSRSSALRPRHWRRRASFCRWTPLTSCAARSSPWPCSPSKLCRAGCAKQLSVPRYSHFGEWHPKSRTEAVCDAAAAQHPKQLYPVLQRSPLRLPADVIECWKATGPGWQTRMADRLSKLR